MRSDLPLFPAQASTTAPHVDLLFLVVVALSIFFASLVVVLLLGFAVKYRRRAGDKPPAPIEGNHALEIAWMVIPLILAMGVFVWGAEVYFRLSRPPDDTLNVNVVGKRWMWKLQHPSGRREINELHVPVGTPVRLNMTSEDVIHSFFVPAFRIKADVLPGRYTTLWFEATRTGRYHLFCAEYCGTQHSGMTGWVEVMEPNAFQAWLSGAGSEVSMAAAGERRFNDLGCATCHSGTSGARGPNLDKLYGSEVKLEGGKTATADEAYLRESILFPAARVTAGYQPVMPTFRGLVNEEGILELIEYLKARAAAQETAPTGTPAVPTPPVPSAKKATVGSLP
ncbi:MAG TPA: cytochrome c oxidase subunit II [Candidatus Polarisedimenticolia bacterium]|nr:cytochrome c oxidase subunit II [Candidatus Polarisedimenticolia bacterium]